MCVAAWRINENGVRIIIQWRRRIIINDVLMILMAA